MREEIYINILEWLIRKASGVAVSKRKESNEAKAISISS